MLCTAAAIPVAMTGRLISGCSHQHTQASESEKNPKLGAWKIQKQIQN
jgi:hypothetical protein